MSLSNDQITLKDTEKVFAITPLNFEHMALAVFYYQAEHCKPYRQYLGYLGIEAATIQTLTDIPFLPIEFFKQFDILSTEAPAEACFESSSTTGSIPSRHLVTDVSVYEQSYQRSFERFFGPAAAFCHLALLPGYLERKTSSLVYQVNGLMAQSQHQNNGFYLHNYEELYHRLKDNEASGIPTILWGVSFALWDFAEQYPMTLNHTTIIETGGMKGRRKEITRQELHTILKQAFHIGGIASEYGMTELLSQAYAKTNGLFDCPPWMKVLPRDINDPFSSKPFTQTCGLNIIDLANYNSCSFIATSDIGRVYPDGTFEVLGRFDYSDIRGCNLMAS